MANKLKHIFSNKMFDLSGKIQFKDNEAHRKFLEALKIVQDEGREVEVEGIASLRTGLKDGKMEYPVDEREGFDQFIITPSTEDVPFEVDTEYGKKTVLLKRLQTTDKVILRTEKKEIVYLEIAFLKKSRENTFTYRMQPQQAANISDIIESYGTTLAFINMLFSNESEQVEPEEFISNMKKRFENLEAFFKRLHSIEQEFQITVNPADLNDTVEDAEDVNELYVLLVQKKIVRLNARLNATDATKIVMKQPARELEIGSQIDLTFQGNPEYTIYGQKIEIHTANLLSNAVVKEIVDGEDGAVKILYGDTDSQPMYISFSGYKTAEEAQREVKSIMKHKERYAGALTVGETLGEEIYFQENKNVI